MVDLMKNATILIPIDFSTWPDIPINQQKTIRENFINPFSGAKISVSEKEINFSMRSNGA